MSNPTAEAVNPQPRRHASEADAKADRELCGRFAAGNPGGPGNPFARQTAMFKKAIHAATTPDEAKMLARKIYELAMEGNLAAAKLYFSYTAGKPQEAMDPDRVDFHEMEIYRETAPVKLESAAFIAAGPPETHLHMVRTMRPLIGLMQQQVMKVVNESPADREKREAAEAAEAERILNAPAESVLPEDRPAPAPSPIGSNGAAVLERVFHSATPSPNGVPQEPPSAIDGYGKQPPSPNGKNGHAKGKKKRNRAPKPSPNDRFQFSK